MHSSTKFHFQITILITCLCGVQKAVVEGPRNQTVAQGQKAVFTCRHPTGLVGWKVNDTVIADANLSADISRYYNGEQDELIVVARPDYNRTTVECIAHLIGGGNETSQPVVLIIQGPLDPATDIQRVLDTITWHPPYSLDLTASEIDILYCVKVMNITSQTEEFLFKRCNVSIPYYVNGTLCRDCIYKITIVAYSNGSSPNSGSSTTKIEIEPGGLIPPTDAHVNVNANGTAVGPTNDKVDQGNENSVNIPAVSVPVVLLLIAVIAGVAVATITMIWCKRCNSRKKSRDVERAPESTINLASPGVNETARLIQRTPLTRKSEIPQSIKSDVKPSSDENTSVSDGPSSRLPLVPRKLLASSSKAERHPDDTSVVEGFGAPEPIQLIKDNSDSSALENGKEEDVSPAELELATRGTDPSMLEEGREHKQLEMDPRVLKEGEQELTSGEMVPRVLEDGAEKLSSDVENRQTEDAPQLEIKQSSEVVDQCIDQGGSKKPQTVHSGVAESGGDEMDVNTSFIAVTATGLHVRPTNDAEWHKTAVIPDSVMLLSDLDYKAVGIHNLEDGEKPSVDSPVEHVCSCSPRHRPVMEPPKTQAQRVPSTAVSVELGSDGDDARDVSGSGLGTFSEEAGEGARPVTDTETIKHT